MADTLRWPHRRGMSVEFDVYCLQPRSLQVGEVITLDALDGFFDQYFDGLKPNEVIRFVVLAGGPAAVPQTADQLKTLPLVEARVRRCGSLDGDVEILSCTTLGEWLHSRELSSISSARLQALVPDAPIVDLLSHAAAEGAAYWRKDARRWRSLDETTAVFVHADQSSTRVVVIRTNGTPALATRVEPTAG